MGKAILVVVLVVGGWFVYQKLEESGALGSGRSKLNQLESKKNEEFNKPTEGGGGEE